MSSVPPRLGRVASATLLAPDFDAALASFARALHLETAWRGTLSPALATHLDLPALAGARTAWLGPPDSPWLRVVEAPQAVPVVPMRRHGWLSLEILVGDVDAVAAALPPDWTVLGPPADLDVSPHIRACQALGPCGEMYYLTEVKAPVPPFELPQTRALVDRPFIVVLSTPDRARTQAAWEALAGRAAWAFDTKVTVLNRELGRPLGERYPVAVIQFREQCLVEIDEVSLPVADLPALPAGTWLVSLERDALDDGMQGLGPIASFDGTGYAGARAALWRGPCGERVELIERG